MFVCKKLSKASCSTVALGQLSKQSAFVDSFLQMIWWRGRGRGEMEKIAKDMYFGFLTGSPDKIKQLQMLNWSPGHLI